MTSFRMSPYGKASLQPSPVNRMMASFATDFRDGVDINLGVGYVNERTIPREGLQSALDRVVRAPEKHRQAFNYGGPTGSPNLLASLQGFLLREGLGGLDTDLLARQELLVGPSGATSLLEALADVLAPGIVVTADPMYYIYCNLLERKGFRVLTVPEDEEGPDAAAIETALAELGPACRDLAFFYFVTVNNPSCTILSNARRKRLVELGASISREQGRPVPVIFDQAYEWLIHDPSVPRPVSALGMDEDAVAYEIGTLSKVLAPALRVGYILGPPGDLMRALVQKTSDVGFSAPVLTQEMAAHMLDHHIGAQLRSVNAAYREKAQTVRAAIDSELGPHLAGCLGGRAGFYFYLTLDGIGTGTRSDFFRYLTRTTGDPGVDGPADARNLRVIYIPGEYCVHPRGASVAAGRHQLRVSYGYEEAPAIVRALGLMREAAEYARHRA